MYCGASAQSQPGADLAYGRMSNAAGRHANQLGHPGVIFTNSPKYGLLLWLLAAAAKAAAGGSRGAHWSPDSYFAAAVAAVAAVYAEK